uniref:Uncharacterized protein n=1 Tax=Anguilla anguilla TaxID=7936 RepID=A0A0E9XSF5_ANGAN
MIDSTWLFWSFWDWGSKLQFPITWPLGPPCQQGALLL